MARKIANAIVIALVVMGCAGPAMAAQESGQAQAKEKPLWDIVLDSFKDFKVREQDRVKGLENVNVFQKTSDIIKSGSEKAKGESLRDKK